METFASSSIKIFSKNISNKTMFMSRTLLGRSDICFSRSPNFNGHFHHSISIRHKALQLIASSQTQTEVSMDSETAGTMTQATSPSKTIHVKFQLQKECQFGDQFLLVGNDPIIGMWNLSSAIPLNWSNGHTWAVELDIPTESSIQFKFILKQSTGDILWQPGPDRIFQAWETKSPIVIVEDWENAEAQKIVNENMINQNEELVIAPEMESVVAGNVNYLKEELMPNYNKNAILSDNITYAEDKPIVHSNNEFIPAERIAFPAEGPLNDAKNEVYTANSVGHEKEKAISKNDFRTLPRKKPASVEDKDSSFTYEEQPVLVPGLTSLQAVSSESKELAKPIIIDGSIGIDATKEQNMPELSS